MNTIVVYKSSTGFTKQYAQWIKEECNCDIKDIKDVKDDELSKYDRVIYGGWIMGSMIMGLDKIIKMTPKDLVVFAVGSSPESEELSNDIKDKNNLGNIPFFYFTGGFRFEKLNFFVRTMLKMMKKSVAKKENKTKQDEFMVKTLGTSFDNSDKEYIDPLVEFVKYNS